MDILIKGIFLEQIWTILGPFLVKLYFQASYIFKMFKTESTWLKRQMYSANRNLNFNLSVSVSFLIW